MTNWKILKFRYLAECTSEGDQQNLPNINSTIVPSDHTLLNLEFIKMFYMDVPWSIFAKTTFCKVYTNLSVGNFASETRILELLEKISGKDATTFRELVKPKKISRLLFGKFISIFRRNSE